jgi:hypothetical protein
VDVLAVAAVLDTTSLHVPGLFLAAQYAVLELTALMEVISILALLEDTPLDLDIVRVRMPLQVIT